MKDSVSTPNTDCRSLASLLTPTSSLARAVIDEEGYPTWYACFWCTPCTLDAHPHDLTFYGWMFRRECHPPYLREPFERLMSREDLPEVPPDSVFDALLCYILDRNTGSWSGLSPIEIGRFPVDVELVEPWRRLTREHYQGILQPEPFALYRPTLENPLGGGGSSTVAFAGDDSDSRPLGLQFLPSPRQLDSAEGLLMRFLTSEEPPPLPQLGFQVWRKGR